MDKDTSTGTVNYNIKFAKIFDSFLSYQNKLENFSLNENPLFNKEKLDAFLGFTNKIKLNKYNKTDDQNGVNYFASFDFQ
ncbi:MAG TPA: hypothetical protein PLO89_11375, partial [Spirochaetota bacterium]|nr:hypothetical protein [Spirochaetota bacterium]